MPGPNPGARCSVCNHPQVKVIDDLLRARERSARSLAGTFGLGEKAVGRHLARHVGFLVAPRAPQKPHTAPEPRQQTLSSPDGSDVATVDPADVLRRQLSYLDGLTLDGLTPAQRTDVMESRRRTADSLSKIEPMATPSTVQVHQVEGLGELFARFHAALVPWPEARALLAQVYRDYKLEEVEAR